MKLRRFIGGIPESSIYTYETFDRIRDNHDVDAAYVGLPNSMHREYTVRGARAGKHRPLREAHGHLLPPSAAQ